MKTVFVAALLAGFVCIMGCGASSPYEAGKQYGESVVSSLEKGDSVALNKAKADVEKKTKNMSMEDAAQFLQGYNEAVSPYLNRQLQNIPGMPK